MRQQAVSFSSSFCADQPPLFPLAALVKNKGLNRSMEAVVLTKQRKKIAKLSTTLSSRCRPLLKAVNAIAGSHPFHFGAAFKEAVTKFLRTIGSVGGAQSADSF
jgi:hypothetical protein